MAVLPLISLAACCGTSIEDHDEWVAKNADGSLKSAAEVRALRMQYEPQLKALQAQARQEMLATIQSECAKAQPFDHVRLYPAKTHPLILVRHNKVDYSLLAKAVCRKDFSFEDWEPYVQWVCPDCYAAGDNDGYLHSQASARLYAQSGVYWGSRPQRVANSCFDLHF